MALGLAGAPSLLAGNVDVYITGSTAFRANVYTACQKLFTTGTGTPVYYGDTAHGGATSGFSSSTAAWAMTGTPISALTNLSGNTLTIHGLFTGSVQGMQTVEQSTKLIFANATALPAGIARPIPRTAPPSAFPMRPAPPLPTRRRATTLKNRSVFSLSSWSNQRPPLAQ